MFTRIFSCIRWILDRISIVIGAWFGSQLPQFIQQYTQRLGGHVDELSYLVAKLNQIAAHSNKNLHDFTHKLLNQSDPDIISQGEFLQGIVTRKEELSSSLNHLLDSTLWNRSYYFFSNLDHDTMMATLKSYQPGFSMTLEGIIYTTIGMIFFYGLYRGLVKLLWKW
jgi:hypothetical protein